MMDISQGDIITLSGKKELFVVISKNAFIRSTGMFHICPFVFNAKEGPLHIPAQAQGQTSGVAICEQIKLIDPSARSFMIKDHLFYRDIMEISDAIQGVFEYD